MIVKLQKSGGQKKGMMKKPAIYKIYDKRNIGDILT